MWAAVKERGKNYGPSPLKRIQLTDPAFRNGKRPTLSGLSVFDNKLREKRRPLKGAVS